MTCKEIKPGNCKKQSPHQADITHARRTQILLLAEKRKIIGNSATMKGITVRDIILAETFVTLFVSTPVPVTENNA